MNTTETTPLRDLAVELQRQNETKRDLLVDTRRFSFVQDEDGDGTNDGSLTLTAAIDNPDGVEDFGITRHAHQQIGEFTNIPWKLYDRLLGNHPDLLAGLANGLLAREPKRRMIRTLDGNVRAFLSDRYRPRDNWDLLEQAIIPELNLYHGGVQFKECSLTDTKMYVKVVFPDIEKPVTPKVGDVIRGGLIFQNSEVGSGSLGIYPYTDRLICLNGMVHTDFGQRTVHVGGRITEESWDLYSESTLRLDDEAFFAKCRDTVKAVLNEAVFEQIVQQMKDLSEIRLGGDPVAQVEDITKRHTLTEGEGGSILTALIEGGDLSGWGYVNAITQTARDLDDADRRVELETLAGKLTADSAWAVAAAA
jgi:hypothetical protein